MAITHSKYSKKEKRETSMPNRSDYQLGRYRINSSTHGNISSNTVPKKSRNPRIPKIPPKAKNL